MNEKRTLKLAVIASVLGFLASPADAHVGLIKPNGGENLDVGSVYEIEWRVLIAHNTQNWDLWYSTTGPGGPWKTIVMDLPPGNTSVGSLHTYCWTVPADPSTQVRVRVRMDNFTGTDYEDISDADFTIDDCPKVVTYCTAKSNLVCGTPMMSFIGKPSASQSSGFFIFAGPSLGNKGGLLLYSDAGRAAIPFQGGLLCVNPQPLRRTAATISGGTTGQCDGEFLIDMNAFAQGQAGGNPAGYLTQLGTIVGTQWWGRDSVATGSFLSDALEYEVCP